MENQRLSQLFNKLREPASKALREALDPANWQRIVPLGPKEIERQIQQALVPELLKFNSGELAEFCASIMAECAVQELGRAVIDHLNKPKDES